jgi:hypothetical protein
MNEPAKTARRICLAVGIVFLLFGSALGLTYYLHYRPIWSPEVLGPAARLLGDPSPSRAVRSTRKNHSLLLASVEALDAAVLMLLIASAAARWRSSIYLWFCAEATTMVRSNSALDRTAYRRRYAALRSAGAAGQRER